MQIVLMIILLVAAVFLIAAVLMTKTSEDGLSSTIVGGNTETYYGKEKSGRTESIIRKLTVVACVALMLAVLVIYVIQPDYSYVAKADYWKSLSSYSSVFKG